MPILRKLMTLFFLSDAIPSFYKLSSVSEKMLNLRFIYLEELVFILCLDESNSSFFESDLSCLSLIS